MADRRIQKSQDAIMKAFIELMQTKNFEQITINQIAELADVNRGTIYLHYVDKYDLLDKCIDTHLHKVFDMCIPDESLHHDISDHSAILNTFEYIQQDSAFFYTMLSNKGSAAFRARLQGMIENRIDDMYQSMAIDKLIKKDFFVQFLSSAIIGLLEWWIINSFPYSATDMVDQISMLLKRFL